MSKHLRGIRYNGAIGLDETAEARVALGHLKYAYDWDWESSREGISARFAG